MKKKTSFTAEEKVRHKSSKELHRLVKKLKTFQMQKYIKNGDLAPVKQMKALDLSFVVTTILSITLKEKTLADIAEESLREIVDNFMKMKQTSLFLEKVQREWTKASKSVVTPVAKPQKEKKKTTLIGGRSSKEPVSLFLTSLNGKRRYEEQLRSREDTEETHVAGAVGELTLKKKNRSLKRNERVLTYRKEQQTGVKVTKRPKPTPVVVAAGPAPARVERARADTSSHPSWQAKQTLKNKESNIHVFSGKKITF